MTEYGYMSHADALHTPLDALLLPPGHGEGWWHLDTLWTFKISAVASGGAFSLAEQLIPKGSAPPVHRHTLGHRPNRHAAHPGACEAFFRTTGRPAESLALPPPQQPDLDRLLAGMREHGIEFLAPLLAR